MGLSKLWLGSARSGAYLSEEHVAWLALLSPLMTMVFYVLPASVQTWTSLQFLPQAFGYLSLVVWMRYNTHVGERLGVVAIHVGQGIRWGGVTGILLGTLNTSVILLGTPRLGWDIEFLKETPHATLPMFVLVPWFIVCIAVCVELNYRAFLLGRLTVFLTERLSHVHVENRPARRIGAIVAVGCSALAFAFDPFLVATFKHLHWIALWDGLVWGWLWIRLRNLLAVIVAHAVEVVILYLMVRAALS